MAITLRELRVAKAFLIVLFATSVIQALIWDHSRILSAFGQAMLVFFLVGLPRRSRL